MPPLDVEEASVLGILYMSVFLALCLTYDGMRRCYHASTKALAEWFDSCHQSLDLEHLEFESLKEVDDGAAPRAAVAIVSGQGCHIGTGFDVSAPALVLPPPAPLPPPGAAVPPFAAIATLQPAACTPRAALTSPKLSQFTPRPRQAVLRRFYDEVSC